MSKTVLDRLERYDVEIDFDLKDPVYPLVTPGEKYRPRYDEDDGTYTRDYGLLARVPHPLIEGRTVVLLMGSKGYGTLAASKYLTDPTPSLERALEEVNSEYRGQSFYMVLETEPEEDGKVSGTGVVGLEGLGPLEGFSRV